MITASLSSKRMIAIDTFEFVFQTQEYIEFEAGQYVKLFFSEISPDVDKNRRKFSLVNSPTDNQHIVIATRMRESPYKQRLSQLEYGSKVEFQPPKGDLILPKSSPSQLVFIAGGIGITPFMSMIHYIEDTNLSWPILLFFFNQTQTSTPYLSELEAVSHRLNSFQLVTSITRDPQWQGEHRKFTATLLNNYLPNIILPLYYVVGTPQMVEQVRQTLIEAGVNFDHIKTEDFTGYGRPPQNNSSV